jgi:hypothetical protein
MVFVRRASVWWRLYLRASDSGLGYFVYEWVTMGLGGERDGQSPFNNVYLWSCARTDYSVYGEDLIRLFLRGFVSMSSSIFESRL